MFIFGTKIIIKSRNEVVRLIVFARFLLPFFPLLFFPPKFCLDEFLVTTGQIVLKFGYIVDLDVKLCKRVSKFKMLDSKAGPRVPPKPQKFWPDFLTNHRSDCSEFFFFDMINIDI